MGMVFNPGSVIDKKYQVIKQIGRGSVGTVYEVKHLNDKTNVAMKIVDVFADDNLKRRTEREIRIMQKITHPNVIRILDSAEVDDAIYIIMPLAIGNLASEAAILSKDHKKAFEAYEKVCLGVHAIHEAGIFHRDIKPANCLRLKDGTIAVSDMGIARFDERDTETLTTTNASLGTAAYMAPEQCEPGGAKNADGRTDVFQLGKTLYQFLTDDFPMYMDLNKVPVGVRHIVSRATQRAKDDRYQNVAEVMDAVQLYLKSIDPKINIKAAFENVKQGVSELAAQGRYKSEFLAELFVYACKLFDQELGAGLISFDTIDPSILGLGAQQSPTELIEVLKHYVKAIDNHVGSYGWSYAEEVAKRMSRVFNESNNATLRSLALEATLSAAVALHRFAAMDVFAANLKKVTEEESLAVAEMLRRRLDCYKVVAAQIGDGVLPMLIDAVRKDAIAAHK